MRATIFRQSLNLKRSNNRLNWSLLNDFGCRCDGGDKRIYCNNAHNNWIERIGSVRRSEDRQIWKIIRWPPIDRILKFYYCFVGVLLLLPFSFFFFFYLFSFLDVAAVVDPIVSLHDNRAITISEAIEIKLLPSSGHHRRLGTHRECRVYIQTLDFRCVIYHVLY